MKKNILIVDAYNMIGNWPELEKLKKHNKLEDARDQLLRILSNYHKQANADIIVVFDAMYVPGIAQKYDQYNLTVVFTAEEQTADTYIEKLAGELQTPITQVRVATSDQAEQWVVFSQGALRLPAWELYQEIKRSKKEVSSAAKMYQNQGKAKRLTWSDEQLDKLAKLRDSL